MREYSNCYIAYLDLLGFKNIVSRKSCEDIAKLFDEIQERYIVAVDSSKKVLMDYRRLKIKIMSDSICLYVDSSVRNALPGLVAFCGYFQQRLLRLEEPILTRGAIVKGDLYAEKDKDIMFGKGFVQAYQMEENTAVFPRVIFTKSLIDESDTIDEYGRNYLQKFTFSDEDAFMAIDYLYLFYGLRHDYNDWKSFARFVQKELDGEMDSRIREKYLYVKKNIERVRAKYIEQMKLSNKAS